MGRRFILGLGTDFEPVSPSQQLFPNALPVVTTSSQIWIAEGDVMGPWKGKFVPVEGWDSGSHMSCEATERPLWTTVIIWDDYMRWSQWGKGCSMLLRVDPDPGTQPVLCVTGETQLIITCSPGHRAGPSPVPRDRLCNKTPGLPAVLCGVTWLWDELWKFPTASVVLFSTKKHS